MKAVYAITLAAAVLAGCSSMDGSKSQTATADTPTRSVDGVLIGPSGNTLYTFANDPVGEGKSFCNAQCAVSWPALAAPAAATNYGDYTVITRNDGSKQWAYKGAPLYYFVRDTKPGERTGDGLLNGAWKLARQ